MADIIGLIFLAALVAVTSFFVPIVTVPGVLWIFTYLMWAAGALFLWHHPKAPRSPKKWLLLALGSVICAPLWFGFAALAARVFFPGAEPTLSRTFDIIVTMILAPGITFIAVTGALRALMLDRKEANVVDVM